jgi:hypothetical protein
VYTLDYRARYLAGPAEPDTGRTSRGEGGSGPLADDAALPLRDGRHHVRDEPAGGRCHVSPEVERLRAHLADLSREEPVLEAERALLALVEEIRCLAEGYEPADGALVRSLTVAIAHVIEQVVVHPREAPMDAKPRPNSGRSVFLVGKRHLIEMIARETLPQPVRLADGSLVYAELPAFERVSLGAENAPITSVLGALSARLLRRLADQDARPPTPSPSRW